MVEASDRQDPRAAWARAFVAAQAEMTNPATTRTVTIREKSGSSFSYKYAELHAILDAARPILAKHDLAAAQDVTNVDDGVAVTTVLYHVDGHAERFGPFVVPASGDAKARGGAVTYARRYALAAVLGIAADEDRDAAGQQEKKAPAARAKAEPKPTPTPTEEATAAAAAVTERATSGRPARKSDDEKAATRALWKQADELTGSRAETLKWLRDEFGLTGKSIALADVSDEQLQQVIAVAAEAKGAA